jgi:hypothetical protein
MLNAMHPTWRLYDMHPATCGALAQASSFVNLALWLTQTVKGLP